MSNRTFVIAEAGANHNRSFEQAKALIDVAAKAGADACKFQTYSSETLYSRSSPDFAGYKDINKLIKQIELPREWQSDLKKYCDDVGIEFMSTPFDERAVEQLVELGVKRLKIAGFESTDPRFVRMVASSGLPLIVSNGIGGNKESIERLVSWVKMEQTNPDITILHCNNAYPTPDFDINLGTIDVLKKARPDIKFGLSDHTMGTLAPSLAVAKGATCVEKHFTLSRNLPGPDHPFALEPEQLKEMIYLVRKAEEMNGVKIKNFTSSESGFKMAMRSVTTLKPLKRGHVLTEADITTKRPFLTDSTPASNYYEVIGSTLLSDYDEDRPIMLLDLKKEK